MSKTAGAKDKVKRARPTGSGWKSYVLPVLEETFWAYVAGIVDGEGSVATNRPRVEIVNTDLNLLTFIQNRIGGQIFHKVAGTGSKKDCYCLYFHTHNQVLAVLEKMLPYMIIKRERSLAAIQLIKQKIK